MPAPDFISLYFPETADVPPTVVAAARARLDTHLRTQFPELDTRPNSVFGDLVLTPYAYLLASFEEAMGRFMSDLDLENVAGGVIYNCDFVREYLGNFAIVDVDNLRSTGTVRLRFCVDQAYTVDRRTRYSFGDDNEFSLRLPFPGHLEIVPSHSSLPAGQNARRLVQVSPDRWACDVGLVGTMEGDQVLKGDLGTADLVIKDLDTIQAAADFEFGYPEESLPKLAEKTRKTFYSATLATRSGTSHFLRKEFPEVVSVSPVVSGDPEQLRGAASILGLPDGRADVFVKSKVHGTVDSQVVTLTYDTGAAMYLGRVDFLNPPLEILSVTSTPRPEAAVTGIKFLSRSTDFAKAPYLSSGYSTKEEIHIGIPAPVPPLTNYTVAGVQYHDFTISYNSDPVLRTVEDVVGSPDHSPVAVDVLVRGFVVVRIDELTITYIRKPGVTMALSTARDEIHAYFRSLGYDETLSSSRIIDSMFYAGASSVTGIVPQAYVKFTVADRILPESAPDPATDWASAWAVARDVPSIAINTLDGLIPAYYDPNLNNVNLQTYASAGKRNVCYMLDPEAIVFTETLP